MPNSPDSATAPFARPLPLRVVLLTHYIPLYQVRVFQEIARQVRDFQILLSTPLEPNRDFEPDWGGLDVQVQKNLTFRRRWKDRNRGFQDQLYVHFPYDTLGQLKRLQPDVILSLELGARSIAAATYRSLHKNSRLVLCTYMSEHTEQHRGSMRRAIRRPLLKRADAVTYNGPSCHAYLTDQGVPESKLHPLPYAADDRTVYTGPVERDEDQARSEFISVGQLSERKGVLPLVQQLVRYAAAHPQRPITLNLAGEGPLRETLAAVSRPANFQLNLLGNLAPQKLGKRFATQGAAILPTLADEWLLVVNEALQAGLPLIASRYAQATTSLVRQGVNGWQYDPLQQDSLFAALDTYFETPAAKMASMRIEARQSVAERTPAWAAQGAVAAIAAVAASLPSQNISKATE